MLSIFSPPLLQPGTPAPDFTARDHERNPVTLSALKGRNVVLVFYPHDNTPVCTRQLCEFRDQSAYAAAQNTLVFGVNNGGEKSHAGFRAKHSLPFPLLVDEDNRIARLYHSRGPLWVIRTVYLIDKDGVIRYARRGKPAPEEVLEAAS